jgi:hypothetical protein
MRTHLLFILFYFCYCVSSICAQEERSLSKKEVPSNIQQFILSNYPNSRNLHYYKIQNSADFTIEAEFKNDKIVYALTFSKEGVLQELEQSISFISIENSIRLTIQRSLESHSSEYKIINCEMLTLSSSETYYEITYKGTVNKHKNIYEASFDKAGHLISIE